MIQKILVFMILLVVISCKNDAAQTEQTGGTEEQPGAEAQLKDNNSSAAEERNTITYEDGRTVPASTVDQNQPPTITTTPAANAPSTNSTGISVPTTASQKAAPKATDDVTVKYGKNTTSTTRYSIDPNEPDPMKIAALPLPDPCGLLTDSYVKNVLKLKYEAEKKQGSAVGKGYEKSCFWRFDDASKPNAGILLQVMINPYSNDVDDFPSLLINSKISEGEMNPYNKQAIKFKPWNDVTPNGCYSYEGGKYHWKVGKKYVFMLAFNTSHTESEQRQIAALIGKEVLNNYKF